MTSIHFGRAAAFGLAAAVLATTGIPCPKAAFAVAPHASPTADAAAALVDAYLEAARTRTLDACRAKGIELPADFLAWIDSDAVLRKSVYGCRADPLPVLLGLRSLEIDLGEELVRRDYPQLALAFAIQDSYAPRAAQGTGWNDGGGEAKDAPLPDVSPRARLVLEIPGDPRTPVDTKDPARALDRDDHIVNFLEDHDEIEVEIAVKELPPLEYDERGVAKPQGKARTVMKTERRKPVGADVIASPALQAEFNAYMAAHGHPGTTIDCGERVVHWYSKDAVGDKALRARIKAAHDLFHDAYRAKGRMPAERDRAPSAGESMAWFVRNDRHAFDDATRAARAWPKFPLNAPWPVLVMLAADDQPLREREEIWARFRDEGEFRTYGEYIGGIAQQFDMQSARRVAPIAFSYGSIQMMWKDGGVCGTMGNIGARTNRICGVPASTAGQPGHCAIVLMEQDAKTGDFRCKGGQYATGGDEVTTVHAGWNYDDAGGRRPMVFHQSVAWAVNHGFEPFLDAMVLRRAYGAMPEAMRSTLAIPMMGEAMSLNPFALPLVLASLDASGDPTVVVAALDAFDAGIARVAKAGEYALYRDTVRDLAHARILALPAPKGADANAALLSELERQECDDARLLARSWRAIGGETRFADGCRTAVAAYLASPERTKSKRAADRLESQLKQWEKSVKGKEAKKAWAESLLAAFAGQEALVVKRKTSLDPSVAFLAKVAGREAPKVG